VAIVTKGFAVRTAQQRWIVVDNWAPVGVKCMTSNAAQLPTPVKRHVGGDFHGRPHPYGMAQTRFGVVILVAPPAYALNIIMKRKSFRVKRQGHVTVQTPGIPDFVVLRMRYRRE